MLLVLTDRALVGVEVKDIDASAGRVDVVHARLDVVPRQPVGDVHRGEHLVHVHVLLAAHRGVGGGEAVQRAPAQHHLADDRLWSHGSCVARSGQCGQFGVIQAGRRPARINGKGNPTG